MRNGTVDYLADKSELLKVTSEEVLVEVWPFVKQGIEHILRRDKSAGSWTSQQVFNAIRFGLPTAQPRTTAVELFIAIEPTKKLAGFMVIEPQRDPFRNGIQTGIYIWILFANDSLVRKFIAEGERMCRSVGGDRIVFHSGRRGWMKKAAGYGFRCDQFRWIREVKW